MLLKTRAPDALSISKKLKTLVWGPLPHFPGFLKHSMFPSYTLAPTPEPSYTLCSSPGLPPPRPCALRSLRGALRPEPLFSPQVVSQTSAASSPRPLPGEQGLLTYPEAGLGSRLGGVSADGGGLRGGAGAAPGPRPADPAVGAARSQAGGGLRRGRDEGRGGTAREVHGGIARHRAGQLRSARLRCSLHGSQQPPGAKPKPWLAGGEEGGGAWWGRGLGQAGGATEGRGRLGGGLWWWAGPMG